MNKVKFKKNTKRQSSITSVPIPLNLNLPHQAYSEMSRKTWKIMHLLVSFVTLLLLLLRKMHSREAFPSTLAESCVSYSWNPHLLTMHRSFLRTMESLELNRYWDESSLHLMVWWWKTKIHLRQHHKCHLGIFGWDDCHASGFYDRHRDIALLSQRSRYSEPL